MSRKLGNNVRENFLIPGTREAATKDFVTPSLASQVDSEISISRIF